MDEFWWTLMTIVGPAVLLVLLIWLVLRSARRRRGEAPPEVTERATRDEYAREERMRREGTDDREA